MTYPRDNDIKRHEHSIFTSMIQYFSGYVTKENIEADIRALMGDASLWVNNKYQKIDLEEVKKIIASVKLDIPQNVKLEEPKVINCE